ncbi:MAG: hypothetical protein V1824_03715 [archaeon]
MSLYKNREFEENGDPNKGIKLIIIIIIVLALLIVGYLLITKINLSVFSKAAGNIQTKFKDNPFNLTKKQSTNLEISIRNTSQVDAKDVTVNVWPVENSFKISCEGEAINNDKKVEVLIPIIASQNKRIITCAIEPNKQVEPILAGTYSFDIEYNQSGEIFKKRATFAVTK